MSEHDWAAGGKSDEYWYWGGELVPVDSHVISGGQIIEEERPGLYEEEFAYSGDIARRDPYSHLVGNIDLEVAVIEKVAEMGGIRVVSAQPVVSDWTGMGLSVASIGLWGFDADSLALVQGILLALQKGDDELVMIQDYSRTTDSEWGYKTVFVRAGDVYHARHPRQLEQAQVFQPNGEDAFTPNWVWTAVALAPFAVEVAKWAYDKLPQAERDLMAYNRERRKQGLKPVLPSMKQQRKARGFALKGIPYHYDHETAEPIEGPRPNNPAAIARGLFGLAKGARAARAAWGAARAARAAKAAAGAGKIATKRPGAFRGAYRWAKEGLSKSKIVEKLKQSKIPSKLANAVADAAINVVADEVGEGIRAGGRRLRERHIDGKGRTEKMQSNPGEEYWVWTLDGQLYPIEPPRGPYFERSAKQNARIGAQNGQNHRAVTRGSDPEDSDYEILRIYEAGTGEHLYEDGA